MLKLESLEGYGRDTSRMFSSFLYLLLYVGDRVMLIWLVGPNTKKGPCHVHWIYLRAWTVSPSPLHRQQHKNRFIADESLFVFRKSKEKSLSTRADTKSRTLELLQWSCGAQGKIQRSEVSKGEIPRPLTVHIRKQLCKGHMEHDWRTLWAAAIGDTTSYKVFVLCFGPLLRSHAMLRVFHVGVVCITMNVHTHTIHDEMLRGQSETHWQEMLISTSCDKSSLSIGVVAEVSRCCVKFDTVGKVSRTRRKWFSTPRTIEEEEDLEEGFGLRTEETIAKTLWRQNICCQDTPASP